MRNVELDIIYGYNNKAKDDLGWDYNLSTDQLIETLIEDEKAYSEFKSSN